MIPSKHFLPQLPPRLLPCLVGLEVGLLLTLFQAQKTMGSFGLGRPEGTVPLLPREELAPAPHHMILLRVCPPSVVNSFDTTSRRVWAASLTWEMVTQP